MIIHDTTPAILSDVIDIRLSREIATSYQTLSEIVISCRNNCVEVFRFESREESPVRVGYMVWMEISKETLLHLIVHGFKGLSFDEWKEGNIMFVLDVLFSPNHPRIARAAMKRKMSEYRVIVFFRRGKIQVYRRLRSHYKKWNDLVESTVSLHN